MNELNILDLRFYDKRVYSSKINPVFSFRGPKVIIPRQKHLGTCTSI